MYIYIICFKKIKRGSRFFKIEGRWRVVILTILKPMYEGYNHHF